MLDEILIFMSLNTVQEVQCKIQQDFVTKDHFPNADSFPWGSTKVLYIFERYFI